MQALKLPAAAGWRWVAGGWRIFRRQPFSFTALLFFYWLLLLCASAFVGWTAQAIGLVLPFVPTSLVATVGSLLVAALTPALTVGFLQACRVAAAGEPIHPVMLFAPFRAGRQTLSRLLVLGAVQMAAVVVILLPSAFRDAAPERPAAEGAGATGATPPTGPAAGTDRPRARVDARTATVPTEAEQEAIRREAVERLTQGLAYLPVALLMWYAPLLVAWHGVPPGKALFFSLVAVWRNGTAFVVYGAAWLGVWLALSVAIGLVTGLLGVGNLAALLAAPLVMLLLTCMYCSVYPTYASVFVDPAVPAPVDAAA